MTEEYRRAHNDRTEEDVLFDQYLDAIGDSIEIHVSDVPRSLLPDEQFTGTRKEAADHEWTQYLLEIPLETSDQMARFARKHRWNDFLRHVRSVDAFPKTFDDLRREYLARKRSARREE